MKMNEDIPKLFEEFWDDYCDHLFNFVRNNEKVVAEVVDYQFCATVNNVRYNYEEMICKGWTLVLEKKWVLHDEDARSIADIIDSFNHKDDSFPDNSINI